MMRELLNAPYLIAAKPLESSPKVRSSLSSPIRLRIELMLDSRFGQNSVDSNQVWLRPASAKRVGSDKSKTLHLSLGKVESSCQPGSLKYPAGAGKNRTRVCEESLKLHRIRSGIPFSISTSISPVSLAKFQLDKKSETDEKLWLGSVENVR